MELAGQRRRQVEAEPVHVHLGHPVAQAVHQQLEDEWLPHVQAVSGARIVRVEALVVLHQAVIGRIVDASERQCGAHLVAFRGVVVDHVEDHLDARFVQRPHHGLELLHLTAGIRARAVLRVGREEADRVVTPVI